MITAWSASASRSGQHAAAAAVELGEHVVEQQERRSRQQLRLRQQEREEREPLLAL